MFLKEGKGEKIVDGRFYTYYTVDELKKILLGVFSNILYLDKRFVDNENFIFVICQK